MQTQVTFRSAILALVLVLTFSTAWELYLRHRGVTSDFDDAAELWAHERAMVCEPANSATVFIGSSRIKYDLDIPTWERLTHNHAIQLAMVESNPRPFLHDLASDPDFKGKLIIDVTEGLFFGNSPSPVLSPNAGIEYYKKRTPAQRVSFAIDYLPESKLAFLNNNYFSLNAFLGQLPIKNRLGVIPAPEFPIGFGLITFERQNKMPDEFLADTSKQNQVKNIWARNRKNNHTPPVTGKTLDTIMDLVKADVDKIRERGGEVV